MAEWTPIENSISLEALLKRWKGIEIDGEKFDFQTVANFIQGCQIIAYDRKDWTIVNGHKEWRGQKRAPILGLNDSDPFNPGVDIIFDQKEIDDLERQMFPSSENSGQRNAEELTTDKTDWRDCNVIQDFESLPSISDSLCRNNLVLAHDADGTICPPHLATFPLRIFFTEMPKPDDGDYYTSNDLMERFKLSPAELVNYLGTHDDLYPYGVPDYYFSSNYTTSKKIEMLDKASFHYREIRNHEKWMQENGYYDKYYEERQRRSIQNEVNPAGDAPRFAELEAQLAEAQKKIEDVEGVRRWNKQFLTERAELKKSLEDKDARIAELEKELAAIKAGQENGKGLADVVCRMRREGKSDEEIAAHLHDDGKWCTQAQVGALLHADESRVASDSMQQRARRLLGKA